MRSYKYKQPTLCIFFLLVKFSASEVSLLIPVLIHQSKLFSQFEYSLNDSKETPHKIKTVPWVGMAILW